MFSVLAVLMFKIRECCLVNLKKTKTAPWFMRTRTMAESFGVACEKDYYVIILKNNQVDIRICQNQTRFQLFF